MARDAEAVEQARKQLHYRRTFPLAPDRQITVAFLISAEDWRPLKAPWWKKKEACIIGADLNGNFFLRHCDGSVRYWDHNAQTDTTIAAGVAEFCRRLIETA
ncbi:MAG TPA: hypothetical protein VKV32_15425 [Stellaceae bacterium]|nr:hypothetical protein [Stellaceae bacterium]